jgi:ion channel-forming bestrophin family protein
VFTTLVNSLVLGVLLGFRNREAYERWWEARKLWGQLVNDSRNLSIKISHLSRLSQDDRHYVGQLIVAFAVALKNHLRGDNAMLPLPGHEKHAEQPKHPPIYIASLLQDRLSDWQREGKMSDFDRLILDPHARGFVDVLGACERIKSSPMPLSYRSLLRHGLVLYLASTPWLVVEQMGWGMIPLMGIVGYFLMGVEFTAEDVEDPFGHDGDDLALGAFCDTIRRSVKATLGINE